MEVLKKIKGFWSIINIKKNKSLVITDKDEPEKSIFFTINNSDLETLENIKIKGNSLHWLNDYDILVDIEFLNKNDITEKLASFIKTIKANDTPKFKISRFCFGGFVGSLKTKNKATIYLPFAIV